MKKLFIIFLFVSKGFCGITLINDTPFTLVAVVQGGSGILLNQVNIQPGEQTLWVEDYRTTNLDIPGAPNVSMTPYRVLWKCSNGGFYSTCYTVGPGSLVKASLCSGAHYCKPKDPEPEKQECPACICPPYPIEQIQKEREGLSPSSGEQPGQSNSTQP